MLICMDAEQPYPATPKQIGGVAMFIAGMVHMAPMVNAATTARTTNGRITFLNMKPSF